MPNAQSSNNDISSSLSRVHARLDELVTATAAQHTSLSNDMHKIALDVTSTKATSGQALSATIDNRTAISALSTKVSAIETAQAAEAGAKGVWAAILRSPLFVGLATFAVGIFTALKAWGSGQ